MDGKPNLKDKIINESINIYSKIEKDIPNDDAMILIIKYLFNKFTNNEIEDEEGHLSKEFNSDTYDFSKLDALFKNVKLDELEAEDDDISPRILQDFYLKLYKKNNDKDNGTVYTPNEVANKMALDLILGYFEENSIIKKDLLKRFIVENELEDKVKEHINQNKEILLKCIDSIKCLDICCGCGSLGIALIKLTHKILNKINNLSKVENINYRKINFIYDNLFGIDRDKAAIYIYKLRLALIILNIDKSYELRGFNNVSKEDALKKYGENHNQDICYDFDVIIGNPPFITYRKWHNNRKEYQYLEKYFEKGMNFYQYFYCIGIDILKPKGVMTFVTSNEFLTFDYAEKLRKKIRNETLIKEIDCYNERVVFTEQVSGVIITLVKVNKTTTGERLNTINKTEDYNKNDFWHIELFKGEKFQIRFYGDNSRESQILEKIVKYPKLNVYADVIYGLHTENKKETSHVLDKYKIAEDNNLEKDFIKKLGLGEEIKKYRVNDDKKYIIYLTNKSYSDNRENIPNIIRYLNNKSNDKDESKYYLKSPRITALNYFEANEKIVVRKNDLSFKFGIDNYKKYWKSDVIMMLPKDKINIYFLLAILNSKVTRYYLDNTVPIRKDGMLINKKCLLDIHIPNEIKDTLINSIEEKVKKILKEEDIKENEFELEKLIYDIYKLKEEEIEFINEKYNSPVQ